MRLPTLGRRLPMFLVVGGLTAGIYFGLLFVFLDLLKFSYPIGVSIAYGGAVCFHFFTNRRVTFGAADGSLMRQSLRYSVLVFTNYVLTLGIVYVAVEIMHSSPYAGAGIAIIATTLFSYVVSQLWVFVSSEKARQ